MGARRRFLRLDAARLVASHARASVAFPLRPRAAAGRRRRQAPPLLRRSKAGPITADRSGDAACRDAAGTTAIGCAPAAAYTRQLVALSRRSRCTRRRSPPLAFWWPQGNLRDAGVAPCRRARRCGRTGWPDERRRAHPPPLPREPRGGSLRRHRGRLRPHRSAAPLLRRQPTRLRRVVRPDPRTPYAAGCAAGRAPVGGSPRVVPTGRAALIGCTAASALSRRCGICRVAGG
mmetsp:Transcript_2722/g.8439  ORF Transcript_2722/g.8439 Transcript_2722/m.8439 type:complete len:233 (+) Transcript_2722:1828-2526(+)